jgi:hypothetical protein
MSFCLIFSGNDKPVDLDFLEADDQMLVSYSQSIEQNIINTKTQTPTFTYLYNKRIYCTILFH